MTTPPPPAPATTQRAAPIGLFVAGTLALLVAAGASGALVIEHFGGIGLPGCGAQGGCGAAAKSVYGTIPPIGLPTSMLGFAYFMSVLVGYLVSMGRPGAVARWVARLGGLASLGFLVISVVENLVCPYCIASHVANFAFIGALELTPRPGARRGAGLLSALAVFLVLMGGLGIAEAGSRVRAREKAEEQERESTRAAIAKSQADVPANEEGDGDPAESESPALATPGQTEAAPAFTGRYRLGPEIAPVRIVIFSDYQCPECKSMELQAMEVALAHPEVSLSAKHFPFCTDCNKYMPANNNKHPNACRAARAAEAAGKVGGTDAFWTMHKWLFSVNGAFNDQMLSAQIVAMGLDPAAFVAAMNDPATTELVAGDVEEGMALGVRFTPTVYVNGVELRGTINAGALMRAVEAILATNPPALAATADKPPDMRQKVVEDWLAERPMGDPVDERAWSLGPEDAPLKLSVWGDYSEPFTARADTAIREIVASRSDLRYVFRHYPANRGCNPYVQQIMFPFSCYASRAAEAAGELGGEAAYWKMHTWLLSNQSAFTEQNIVAAGAALGSEFGYDEQRFVEAYRGRDAKSAIDQDVRGAQRIGVQSLPTMTLNERKIPRWIIGETVVLDRIIDAAAKELAENKAAESAPK